MPRESGGRVAPVIAAAHDDRRAADRLAAAVAAACPGYGVSAGAWEGEREVSVAGGSGGSGARYLWPVDGRAEVFLPAGYRTQEGDGAPLPTAYAAEPLPPAARDGVETLRAALTGDTIHLQLQAPVAALCARASGGSYTGDARGDLWLLLESGVEPREWATTNEARLALGWFVRHFTELGWSTKQTDGWEPLLPGDQLIATSGRPLRVRGRCRFWAIDDANGAPAPGSAVRRLRFLRDTAGGCSPGFDAFRRLNLTWHPTAAAQRRVLAALAGPLAAAPAVGSVADRGVGQPPPSGPGAAAPDARDPDAPNRLNSHVLHIEAAQSRTHYHPEEPVGGGTAQHELYFVLDPAAYGLRAPAGAVPRLYTFPDTHDWSRYEATDLAPGLAAYIPPGTGHRGVDAFTNVVTMPGFKPRNEIYVDRLIAAAGAGAPFNEAMV